MSEAQKDVTIVLGSVGLTYNTKEGDQVVSVKKSELDAKSEEFESVSISLKRLREENAALSERLREAEAVIEWYADKGNWYVIREFEDFYSCPEDSDEEPMNPRDDDDFRVIGGVRARAYLSKTPKEDCICGEINARNCPVHQ